MNFSLTNTAANNNNKSNNSNTSTASKNKNINPTKLSQASSASSSSSSSIAPNSATSEAIPQKENQQHQQHYPQSQRPQNNYQNYQNKGQNNNHNPVTSSSANNTGLLINSANLPHSINHSNDPVNNIRTTDMSAHYRNPGPTAPFTPQQNIHQSQTFNQQRVPNYNNMQPQYGPQGQQQQVQQQGNVGNQQPQSQQQQTSQQQTPSQQQSSTPQNTQQQSQTQISSGGGSNRMSQQSQYTHHQPSSEGSAIPNNHLMRQTQQQYEYQIMYQPVRPFMNNMGQNASQGYPYPQNTPYIPNPVNQGTNSYVYADQYIQPYNQNYAYQQQFIIPGMSYPQPQPGTVPGSRYNSNNDPGSNILNQQQPGNQMPSNPVLINTTNTQPNSAHAVPAHHLQQGQYPSASPYTYHPKTSQNTGQLFSPQVPTIVPGPAGTGAVVPNPFNASQMIPGQPQTSTAPSLVEMPIIEQSAATLPIPAVATKRVKKPIPIIDPNTKTPILTNENKDKDKEKEKDNISKSSTQPLISTTKNSMINSSNEPTAATISSSNSATPLTKQVSQESKNTPDLQATVLQNMQQNEKSTPTVSAPIAQVLSQAPTNSNISSNPVNDKVSTNTTAEVDQTPAINENKTNNSVSDLSSTDKLANDVKRRTYTSEEIERKVTLTIEEYVQNNDLGEALRDCEEFRPVDHNQYIEFVELMIMKVLERSEIIRNSVGQIFFNAIKQKKIDTLYFTCGLKNVLSQAEDIAIDIPKIASYLSQILSPFLQSDSSIEFLIDACEPIKNKPICADFISDLLHNASNKLGHNSVSEIFRSSNLSLNDFVSNPSEFMNQKSLEWLVKTRERTQSASTSVESYEKKLFEILKNPNVENESIFDTIENEYSDNECTSKTFIRALVMAVCPNCYIDSKIDPDLFKKLSPILTKYIGRKEELELESLFAVQALDTKMKHQPGFMRVIFDLLYDEDIIREDVFWKWKSKEREDGHQICVLSLKGFFDWLNEAEATEEK